MIRNLMRVSFVACALIVAGVGVRAAAPALAIQDAKSPLLNLNAASASELEKLPGVGPAIATRILEYRQKNGSFKKIEDQLGILESAPCFGGGREVAHSTG